MQTRIGNEITLAGGANGGNIADVLNHGSQGNRHNGDDGRQCNTRVETRSEQGKHGVLPQHGQTDPRGAFHAGEVHNAHKTSNNVRDDNAHKNGDDLNHALTEDAARHNNNNGNNGNRPVGLAA